jgi:hypothetical protein
VDDTLLINQKLSDELADAITLRPFLGVENYERLLLDGIGASLINELQPSNANVV